MLLARFSLIHSLLQPEVFDRNLAYALRRQTFNSHHAWKVGLLHRHWYLLFISLFNITGKYENFRTESLTKR